MHAYARGALRLSASEAPARRVVPGLPAPERTTGPKEYEHLAGRRCAARPRAHRCALVLEFALRHRLSQTELLVSRCINHIAHERYNLTGISVSAGGGRCCDCCVDGCVSAGVMVVSMKRGGAQSLTNTSNNIHHRSGVNWYDRTPAYDFL